MIKRSYRNVELNKSYGSVSVDLQWQYRKCLCADMKRYNNTHQFDEQCDVKSMIETRCCIPNLTFLKSLRVVKSPLNFSNFV